MRTVMRKIMQMMTTSTQRLLSYPIRMMTKVTTTYTHTLFLTCFIEYITIGIVDDKYDEADLVHLNSEEAIEFSHTSDNLTESNTECNK